MVLLVQVIFPNCVYADGNTNEKVYSCEYVGKDGVTYSLELCGDNIENCTLTLTNMETQDIKITNCNYGVITTKECIYNGKKWNGEKKYLEKNEKIIDVREEIANAENNEVIGQGYGTTETLIFYTYEADNGKEYQYKYAIGNGKDAGYTKIWCCKTYKVANSNSDLKEYKNAISESNAAYYKSGVSIGTATAAIAIVLAVVASGGTLAVVAPILLTIYGIEGASFYYLIDSYNWGKKAQTYYDSAKESAV